MVHDAIAYAPYKLLQMTIYQFEVPVFRRKTGTSKTYTAYELRFPVNLHIVCQINILVGVQALAWFCQTKVWTPFSESL
jgi:hypothetical protein